MSGSAGFPAVSVPGFDRVPSSEELESNPVVRWARAQDAAPAPSVLDDLLAVSSGGFEDDVVPAAAVAAAAGLPAGALLVPLATYDRVAAVVSSAVSAVSHAGSLSRVEVAAASALRLLDALRSLGLLSLDALGVARASVFTAAAGAAVAAAEAVRFF